MQNKAVWQYIHPVCPTLVPPKKFGQENGKTDTLPALPLPKTDTLPAGMRPAGRRSLKNFINNAQKHAFARRYASQVQKRVFYDVPPLPLPTVTSAAPSAPCSPLPPLPRSMGQIRPACKRESPPRSPVPATPPVPPSCVHGPHRLRLSIYDSPSPHNRPMPWTLLWMIINYPFFPV